MPEHQRSDEHLNLGRPEEPLQAIFQRDEILQILYWLRGEGLAESVAPGDLLAFLQIDEETARDLLQQMRTEGYVACPDPAGSRFQLSAFGIEQGKRLFAAEFAGLTTQGHGECSNPDCACHELGPEACVSHLEEHNHAH